MHFRRIRTALIFFSLIFFLAAGKAGSGNRSMDDKPKVITIGNPTISMSLDYDNKASITSFVINGQKVIGSADGIFTSVNVGGTTYSSLHIRSAPVLVKIKNIIKRRNSNPRI